MRIVIVETQLTGGGSARTACLLANHWIKRGHTVKMVLLAEGVGFYHLDRKVELMELRRSGNSRGVWQAIWRNWMRVTALRRALVGSDPDVVVSFNLHTNIRALLATTAQSVPVVVCERTNPAKRHFGIWTSLMKVIYRRATAVQCQAKETEAWFKAIGCKRTVVIPNAVTVPEPEEQLQDRNGECIRIVAMGRLNAVKGLHHLLEVFASLSGSHPTLELVILGEGPERSTLEKKARDLGIERKVSMPGQIKDPFAVLRNSSLFVLSSEHEGFPNALAEALACGLPAVAFDCSPSIKEIIDDGKNGLIVPPGDFPRLAQAINELLNDEPRRLGMAANAPAVMRKYSQETVLAQWDRLIDNVTASAKC